MLTAAPETLDDLRQRLAKVQELESDIEAGIELLKDQALEGYSGNCREVLGDDWLSKEPSPYWEFEALEKWSNTRWCNTRNAHPVDSYRRVEVAKDHSDAWDSWRWAIVAFEDGRREDLAEALGHLEEARDLAAKWEIAEPAEQAIALVEAALEKVAD